MERQPTEVFEASEDLRRFGKFQFYEEGDGDVCRGERERGRSDSRGGLF